MQSPQAPLIGVIADHKTLAPTDRSDSARTFVGAYATYLRCLTAAGALPVVVPLELSPYALRGIFDRLDGILLTGGGDMDPTHFHEAPHPAITTVKAERDTAEILVARWAAQQDVPLLGICRGHQVVNVALEGSLFQDIPTQIPTTLKHDSGQALPLDYVAHQVALQHDSRLAQVLGADDVATNSRHHQAVRQVGSGLRAVAHTADGVIEATESPTARFLCTVQWHPENLCNGSRATNMTPLFAAFTNAAAAYQHDRVNPHRA